MVMEKLVMRLLLATSTATVALLVGCSAGTGHPAASPVPLPPDPHTAAALLKIATVFNHDYDTRDYGPVYARWDARSRAVITRADYIQRQRTARAVRLHCRRPKASAPAARRARGWCVTRSAASN